MQNDNLKNENLDNCITELPAILICDCGSTEHQIVVSPKDENGFVCCYIHLTHYGFLRRLKAGLKYIFGYKCKFGQWDEFILKPEHADKLRELSDILK